MAQRCTTSSTGEVDTGLVGPDSVSWQLHADPGMWLAGIRSLYLQALHPLVVAGVIQNSDFQQDPLGRLIRTANFVSVSTYGSTDEAAALGGRVRAIHRTLRLTDPASGRTHRVDEPELLLWVHCAEVASFAEVCRRAGVPLNRAQLDRYFAEQRAVAELVGLHVEDVPGSARQMADYFGRMRPVLRTGDDAAIIYRFLHRPPLSGRLRAGLLAYEPFVGHLAYSLLPSWATRMYGHRGYPRLAATAMLRAFRSAALLAPPGTPFLGRGPHLQAAVDRIGSSAIPATTKLACG
ncbi:MAG: oxygenase MpaB family protein [Sciscionella sp.]